MSPVKYTIAAVMLPWPLKVEMISYDNRASDILCLYIEVWVVEEFIAETWVDSRSEMKLIRK